MRPFTDVLRDHRNGKLVELLTLQLAEAVEAAGKTGKAAALTLKLKIVPSKGDDGVFEVIPDISVTIPRADLPKGLFYTDGEGSLVRDPPKGGTLFAADEIEAERERRRGGD